jgi:hypothetical protein
MQGVVAGFTNYKNENINRKWQRVLDACKTYSASQQKCQGMSLFFLDCALGDMSL